MKFRYSVSDPSQNEYDSLPRLTFSLRCNNRQAEVVGLVDSGATVNVLPYEAGVRLGLVNSNPSVTLDFAGADTASC